MNSIVVNGVGPADEQTGEDPPTARVASNDGTEIAYWSSGYGPPLVLVHGATVDHTNWEALRPYLEPHVAVHAVDRRGRGASGDASDYDLTREYQDIAAVVDAVARGAGQAVDVLGHSYGGLCAFGAAGVTSNVRSLVLYEGWPWPDPGLLAADRQAAERLEPLLATGHRELALEMFYREIVNVSEEELSAVKALPTWPARVAAVDTGVRELRAGAVLDPERAAQIAVPVLLLVGSDTPEALRRDPETVADTLPDARILVLDGQQHLAQRLAPEVLAKHVLAFLREEP